MYNIQIIYNVMMGRCDVYGTLTMPREDDVRPCWIMIASSGCDNVLIYLGAVQVSFIIVSHILPN